VTIAAWQQQQQEQEQEQQGQQHGWRRRCRHIRAAAPPRHQQAVITKRLWGKRITRLWQVYTRLEGGATFLEPIIGSECWESGDFENIHSARHTQPPFDGARSQKK
jgi:hypothetical protein